MKVKFAKLLRALTVPPMLVLLMVVFLYAKTEVFSDIWQGGAVLLFLAVIPALAYLLQPMIPCFARKENAGMRKLAMILSAIGYPTGVVMGYAFEMGGQVQLIFNTYLLSLIILIIFNLLKIRASGHACSVSGPLLFLCVYGHYFVILPCLLISAAVVWSSLTLKRHTVKELLLGASVSMGSFLVMQFWF